MMSNKTYDVLKFIAQIVLPALATFYVTIAGLWGLPFPKEISGTVMAFDTFLGALLMLSNAQYKKSLEENEKTEESEDI